MKFVRYMVAIMIMVFALPSIAQADRLTSITVTKVAVAGDTTPFTFTITGPKCHRVATNAVFRLSDGNLQETELCDSPWQKEKRFKVTETVPAGWSLASISCTSKDKKPKDAFIYEIETGSVFVELSPGERKFCTFTNVPLPTTAPVAPAPPPPGPPAVVPPTPVHAPVTPPRRTHKRKRCRRVRSERTGERVTVCRKKQRRPGKRPGQPTRPNFTG